MNKAKLTSLGLSWSSAGTFLILLPCWLYKSYDLASVFVHLFIQIFLVVCQMNEGYDHQSTLKHLVLTVDCIGHRSLTVADLQPCFVSKGSAIQQLLLERRLGLCNFES